MYTEPAGIVAQAEVYLPRSAAEAMAYYAIRKPSTRAELVNLALLIRDELAKIHSIMDDVMERCQTAKDAEEQKEE